MSPAVQVQLSGLGCQTGTFEPARDSKNSSRPNMARNAMDPDKIIAASQPSVFIRIARALGNMSVQAIAMAASRSTQTWFPHRLVVWFGQKPVGPSRAIVHNEKARNATDRNNGTCQSIRCSALRLAKQVVVTMNATAAIAGNTDVNGIGILQAGVSEA